MQKIYFAVVEYQYRGGVFDARQELVIQHAKPNNQADYAMLRKALEVECRKFHPDLSDFRVVTLSHL